MSTNIDTLVTISNRIIKLLNNNIFFYGLSKSEIHYEIKFDCNMWSNGATIRVDNQQNNAIILEPISGVFIDILSDIACNLEEQLWERNTANFAYKSQIERLLCTVIDLKNKITSIKSINRGNDGTNIIAHLLHTLVQTLLLLVNILETILGLRSQTCHCHCHTDIAFNLFMGLLVNKITELQVLLKDWHALVINFLSYSPMPMSSYVASYIPKQPIAPAPPPMQNLHICVPNQPNPDYNLIQITNSCNHNNF